MTRGYQIGPKHFAVALGLAVVLFAAGKYLHSEYPNAAETVQHVTITIASVVIIELAFMTFLAGQRKSEIQEAVEETLSRNLSMVDRAKTVGLTHIYPDRDAALADAKDAVQRARSRVWIHGVSLSNQLNVRDNEIMSIIANAAIDTRVLLLDPTRSTSVYRALLEGTPEGAKQIIDAHSQPTPPAEDPLLKFPLFGESRAVLDKLTSPLTQRRVKFYGHAPAGWLVIADETAFFQPYTFGKDASHEGAYQQTGCLMPVFRFVKPRRDKVAKMAKKNVNPSAMEVLASHFDRVWRTSNCDYLMMRIRSEQDGGVKTLHDIFKKREDWLRHVVDELLHPEKRESVRHACSSEQKLTAQWSVVAEHDEQDIEQPKTTMRVVNYCLGGLGFEVTQGKAPPVGANLTIAKIVGGTYTDFGTSALNQRFFGKGTNTFEVMWSKDKRLGCKAAG